MAVLTSAGITFGDATTQSTAATAAALVTTANVLSATAGATAGAVGTYAYAGNQSTAASLVAGTTYAGSSLAYAGISKDNTAFGNASVAALFSAGAGATLSGTWRAMGSSSINWGCNSPRAATLMLRIS